jgi:hypothetical protein
MHASYYYKAHACIMVFDVTRKVTYKNLEKWWQELQEFQMGIPTIVVANKIDVDPSVTKKAFAFATKHDVPFFFVSASDGTNVVRVRIPSPSCLHDESIAFIETHPLEDMHVLLFSVPLPVLSFYVVIAAPVTDKVGKFLKKHVNFIAITCQCSRNLQGRMLTTIQQRTCCDVGCVAAVCAATVGQLRLTCSSWMRCKPGLHLSEYQSTIFFGYHRQQIDL